MFKDLNFSFTSIVMLLELWLDHNFTVHNTDIISHYSPMFIPSTRCTGPLAMLTHVSRVFVTFSYRRPISTCGIAVGTLWKYEKCWQIKCEEIPRLCYLIQENLAKISLIKKMIQDKYPVLLSVMCLVMAKVVGNQSAQCWVPYVSVYTDQGGIY